MAAWSDDIQLKYQLKLLCNLSYFDWFFVLNRKETSNSNRCIVSKQVQAMLHHLPLSFVVYVSKGLYSEMRYLLQSIVQGGSNMTGTNCDLFTHNQSRSYFNHLVQQSREICLLSIILAHSLHVIAFSETRI
jgi:hypothetical protein